MKLLRTWLRGERAVFSGEFYDFDLDAAAIWRSQGRCPPFYFGGLSEAAREVAAEEADVFLMWPDTEAGLAEIIADLRARAARHARTLRFGYRVHVIVRESEREARHAERRGQAAPPETGLLHDQPESEEAEREQEGEVQ